MTETEIRQAIADSLRGIAPEADLATIPPTSNMREALERTWRATPDPKWVVAVGDCGADAGVFAGSPADRKSTRLNSSH